MKKRRAIAIGFSALAQILSLSPAFLPAGIASAQSAAVNVTITADDPVLIPGQTTTVRVFAQIAPEIEPDAKGIFSWYVDALNSDGTVAVADYDNLTMYIPAGAPASNTGSTVGADRLGIQNIFFDPELNAGKAEPVELLNFQLTASQLGVTTLSVRAGTTEPLITDDFLVDPTVVDDPPFTGGDYTAASAVVKVVPVSEAIQLGISRDAEGVVELDFTPVAGFDQTVMFSDDMSPGSWLALPGAPHNSGVAADLAIGVPRRFYSVFVVKQ